LFETSLQAIVYIGRTEKIRLLLEHGARVTINIPESCCKIALYAAVVRCSIEIVQMLLDKEANIHAKSGIYKTAILVAIASLDVFDNFDHDARIVRILMEKDANVKNQCEKTGTVLQSAMVISSSKEEIINVFVYLLNHKADPTYRIPWLLSR